MARTGVLWPVGADSRKTRDEATGTIIPEGRQLIALIKAASEA